MVCSQWALNSSRWRPHKPTMARDRPERLQRMQVMRLWKRSGHILTTATSGTSLEATQMAAALFNDGSKRSLDISRHCQHPMSGVPVRARIAQSSGVGAAVSLLFLAIRAYPTCGALKQDSPEMRLSLRSQRNEGRGQLSASNMARCPIDSRRWRRLKSSSLRRDNRGGGSCRRGGRSRG